ncbi:hypothetical protein VMCG_06955 [Cytospora schulzeri]|uniref:Cutinase n=1 Tax=Cytospora schulzeri TaxID=448051 RepID=A0A423W3U4_9PEZI|nr:hypothetical protein VMCG_06955 [Valsa malicola]
MKSPTAILPLLPLLTQASTSHHPNNCPPCADMTCPPPAGAAQIIVTRGSTEMPGTGLLDPIASAIAAACPGSVVAANPYPALLDPYVASETAGLDDLARMVLGYKRCCGGGASSGRVVFLGYSQGAQVTADFLCGRSEAGFGATDGYAADVADDVAAIVLVGDPSFVKGLPWDRGNASNGSFFPRLDTTSCLPVADKMISYCDAGDFFCDNGTSTDALLIHESYALRYGAQIVEYVVDKIGGCDADGDQW